MSFMYKIIEDSKNDLFLNPIPKWITFYGFWISVLLFLCLLILTINLKSPNTIQLDVVISKKQSYVKTDFETFSQLKYEQNIKINLPLNSTLIQCKLYKNKSWIERKTIYIPVCVQDSILKSVNFKNEINCKGSLILENKTLFENIFM